jgi:hypothetical protein
MPIEIMGKDASEFLKEHNAMKEVFGMTYSASELCMLCAMKKVPERAKNMAVCIIEDFSRLDKERQDKMVLYAMDLDSEQKRENKKKELKEKMARGECIDFKDAQLLYPARS